MLANNFNIGDKFTYGDYGLITVIKMQGSKWFKSEDGHIFAYLEEDNLIPYKFYYSTWDDRTSFELYSDEKYSIEELKELQNKALNQILEEQKRTKEKIDKYNTGYDDEWLCCETEIVFRIKKILVEKYGFKYIPYKCCIHTNMDDWYKKYIELREPEI